MISFEVDADELLKWHRYLNDLRPKTDAAIARALNSVGDTWVDAIAENLSDFTGLEPNAILNLTTIRNASAGNLEYFADASAVLKTSDWQRAWPQRDTSTFEQDTLVQVITVHDEFRCEVCAKIAADGPYTMSEIKALQGKWAHFHADTPASGDRTDLIHPNCRCSVRPWTSTNRKPVTFKGSGMPPELLTVRQIGERVAAELRIAIRVSS